MSFTENDRKIQPKLGKSFPSFSQAIALALHTEFGGSPAAVKTVSRLTKANERAVRNWFDGKNGPNGDSLISLICRSDTVLKTVLNLAGRDELAIAVGFADLRRRLLDVVVAIDAIQQPIPSSSD